MSKKLENRPLRQPVYYRWNRVENFWEQRFDHPSYGETWHQTILSATKPGDWGYIEGIYQRNPGFYAVRLPDLEPIPEGVSR